MLFLLISVMLICTLLLLSITIILKFCLAKYTLKYQLTVLSFRLAMVSRAFTSLTRLYCSFTNGRVLVLLNIWMTSWSLCPLKMQAKWQEPVPATFCFIGLFGIQ